jgi:hypothetical protein
MFRFFKNLLKKKTNNRKQKKQKEKTAYLMLGRGPVSNPGARGVCGSPIGTDQIGE